MDGCSKQGSLAPRSLPMIAGMIGFAAIAFLVYGQALSHPLLNWDDDAFIRDNVAIRSLGWPQLRWMFAEFHFGHYHPLTWLSYAIDYRLGGGDAWMYFLTNILLHICNAALLWRTCVLLKRTVAPESCARVWTVAAWLAVLTFLIHPCRAEVVAWASERKELLACFFALLSINAYLRAHQLGRRRLVVASGLFMIASVLSKATFALLPVGLCVVDLAVLQRMRDKNRLRLLGQLVAEKWLHWLAMLAAVAFAPLAQAGSGAAVSLRVLSLSDRLGQMCYSLVYYPWVTTCPLWISPLHLFDPEMSIWEPRFLIAAVLATGASFLAWRLRRRHPKLVAAFCCYLLLILPVSGLFQSGMQLVADRYTYAPAMLLAMCLTPLLTSMWHHRGKSFPRVSLAGASTIGLVLAVSTYWAVGIWESDESLWQRAVHVDEENYVAWNGLGSVYLHRGDKQAAREAYERSFLLNEAFDTAAVNLGALYFEMGEDAAAEQVYRTSLAHNPTEPRLHCNLAILLEKQGRLEEALSHCSQAQDSASRLVVTHQWQFREMQVRLLQKTGEYERAAGQLVQLAEELLRAGEPERARTIVRNACITTRFRDFHSLQIAASTAASIGDHKMVRECQILLHRLQSTATASGDAVDFR